jgi:polysaccharide export outer membrane protein
LQVLDHSTQMEGMNARGIVANARVIATAVWLCAPGIVPLVAQTSHESPGRAAEAIQSTTQDTDPSTSERWSSGRYRLMANDVLEVTFPYVPDFNQELTVQPDGYVTLRAVGELRVQGRTLPELRTMLFDAYERILREPVITITLKEFEKPFFIAAGEVKQPGKFELRSPLTVTQALAVAGGMTDNSKRSQVVLFRRYSQELLEVKQLNVKKMLASHDLSEDPLLRPGDTLFVPKSTLARLKPFIPSSGLAVYLNPLSW